MIDWLSSMQQTYEYYTVDPGTWKDVKRLNMVRTCTVSRDAEAETLGSASVSVTNTLGECYIRVYLIAIQNGLKEKIPLGTFLVQTPSSSFDGKIRDVSMDAYTPLLELKESPPPIGYSVPKGDNIMDNAYRITREHARAPVVAPESSEVLYNNFVANTDDTWLTFLSDLIENAKYEFALDELGRILFSPKQDTASLQPVWTYTDDNSSILYPDITMNHDLYGIPNVVEVIYSNGAEEYHARAVNDDPNSPISTVNRGREIIHRVANPEFVADPTAKSYTYYRVEYTKTTYASTDKEVEPVGGVAVEGAKTFTGEDVYSFVQTKENDDGATVDETVYYYESSKPVIYKVDFADGVYTATTEEVMPVNGALVYNATTTTGGKVYKYPIEVETEEGTTIEEVYYTEGTKPIYFQVDMTKIYTSTEELLPAMEGTIVDRGMSTTGDKIYVSADGVYYRTLEESIQMKEYATQLLRDLSAVEYSITYTHAYCPVRLGDCVRLDYARAGLRGIKAKVVSQSIKCEPGCPVTEKAVFTTKLWG